MDWIGHPVVEDGIHARRFDLTVGGDVVPAMLWTPHEAEGPRPLVVCGHGGASDKTTAGDAPAVLQLVRDQGYAALSIDAPGFGDRAQTGAVSRVEQIRRFARLAEDERARVLTGRDGEQLVHEAAQAVQEWKATLDAVQTLDEVGVGPVGYWGLSGGAARGIPFVADEPRVRAAVFGLCGVLREGEPDAPHITRWLMKVAGDRLEAAANALTIPVLFFMQWDDEANSRNASLNLFDAIGSPVKRMQVAPGGHSVPADELTAGARFLVEHLGPSVRN
jgi:pimeloyl-ACP methyl ester carboxylesterase